MATREEHYEKAEEHAAYAEDAAAMVTQEFGKGHFREADLHKWDAMYEGHMALVHATLANCRLRGVGEEKK